MPEPDNDCVPRREFYRIIGAIIGVFVLLLLLLQLEVNSVQAQQKKYNQGQEKILSGVQKVDDDMTQLTQEIVVAKKQEEP
jgi:hypothetical protein